MPTRRVLVLAVVLAAMSTAAGAQAGGKPTTVGLTSLHGALPGMNREQVEAALHVPVPVADTRAFPGCGAAEVSLGGRKVALWFIDGKFARADFDGGVSTPKGIVVGSSLAQLRKAYGGALRFTRQPYSVPGVRDYYVGSATEPRVFNYFSMRNGHVSGVMYGNDFVFAMEGCA